MSELISTSLMVLAVLLAIILPFIILCLFLVMLEGCLEMILWVGRLFKKKRNIGVSRTKVRFQLKG